MNEFTIKLLKMNSSFMALCAAISTRDKVPFDTALITAGNMLAESNTKKEAT